MSTDFFRIEGVNAGYGEVQVLWDVDIEVKSGDIVCIVGSNGAGKSTLLRMISGLVHPTKGRVLISGRNMAAATPERILAAGVAHVPEGRRLFKGMSVKNNLLMGAYLRREWRFRWT